MIETEFPPLTKNLHVQNWVSEMAALCGPERIVWCDGSLREKQALITECLAEDELIELNQEKLPGCYLHRSAQNDVARTEHLTFICTSSKDDVGPTNNWMDPAEAKRKVGALFEGSMRGRTMYVVPFVMGPLGSSFSKVGVQLTDSRYVVLSMGIMARMGTGALNHLGQSKDFTRCLHSKADLDINRRYICHFPEENAIWSVGSAYGGNALLGKKCLALRIGSYLGKKEGWLAEHMLILGIEDPQGQVRYMAAAFPSQCGKTNLAMLVPPEALKGYKVWTVGDDIAWLRVGSDGRLWAVNPEAGFFGVLPGTNEHTNPNAVATIQKNTFYTNVLLKDDGTVWWEGLGNPPAHGIDWKGHPWTPASKEKGAHPNSRFTAPAEQCPSISPEWENPQGVPISAIVFGGRRARVAPLVYESFSWQHGVYVGATMASETTAAAMGAVGKVRRDPMAMLPFCGYHVGDYFEHWLTLGKKITKPPKIFHANWFRTGADGKFLWPGYGENLRVLLWILSRTQAQGQASLSPIGYIPTPEALNLSGLSLSPSVVEELLSIHPEDWMQETSDQREFLNSFGQRLPGELLQENDELKRRLANF